MALTNAQRQARLRSKRRIQGHFQAAGTAMERLDTWVSAEAAHGLRTLAALHGTPAQEVLDGLILAAIKAAKQADRASWFEASNKVDDSNVTR